MLQCSVSHWGLYAGISSSRQCADGLGEPVVSGYGVADLLTEALGGFFWFGALNSIRHVFEPLDAFTKMFSPELPLGMGIYVTRQSSA